MNARYAVEKFTNCVSYFLNATKEEDKVYYGEKLKGAIIDIFKSSYPQSNTRSITLDIRENINTVFNDVIVIKRPSTFTSDGKTLYNSGEENSSFIISFSQDCGTKYDAETITALVMYAMAAHMTNFVKQRVRGSLYHIISKYKLSTESNEVNQLSGVFSYIFSIKFPYLVPTDKFETYPILDMLFFLSPAVYDSYAKFVSKTSKDHLKLVAGTRHDAMAENQETDAIFSYHDNAVALNEAILIDMIKNDKRQAAYLTTVANDGKLDSELEEIHEMSNIKIKLKDILTSDGRSNNILFESVAGIVNESIFKSESEFRYKLNKIIIASKYLDTEDERTAILVDMYNLKGKLNKFIEKEEGKITNMKNKKEEMDQISKVAYLKAMLTELQTLETTIVNSDLKPKKFGVFMEYPAGYDY